MSELGEPSSSTDQELHLTARLKRLYPAVSEEDTPLPRSWSPRDKYSYIGLSQNNLRVHYKGHGKNHKDAASVRATHPIPAACGIYYFEVKIVSKGRDGYMGIGLSAQGVNMNRLPGWDKHSYGYHGDDGHSFCSSGTGQPYGPTFTTGDVIGCCVNLINNTCFYTKNGISLGVAFTDLPPNLYPTVGLQTPGEIVDANFGQQPFIFDIEDYMSEWRAKIDSMIARFPIGERLGEWQSVLQNMVSSYLVHHGYCATATAFARATETLIQEDQSSIKNRQRIQKLVLSGRVGEAIESTEQLYPGLLEHNPNLLFMLKCRQFVEMVNGTDSEELCFGVRSPKYQDSHPGDSHPGDSHPGDSHPGDNHSGDSQPGDSQPGDSQPGDSQPGDSQPGDSHPGDNHSGDSQPGDSQPGDSQPGDSQPGDSQPGDSQPGDSQPGDSQPGDSQPGDSQPGSPNLSPRHEVTSTQLHSQGADSPTCSNGVTPPSRSKGSNSTKSQPHSANSTQETSDSEMEIDSEHYSNGVAERSSARIMNGTYKHQEILQTDTNSNSSREAATERMIQFGRELQTLSEQLSHEYGKNITHKKMLQDAFSLLAYSDPWSSPLGQQLDPMQRESLCSALNSAILALGQATECVQLMARVRSGSCSFARVDNFLH
ncbi:hypothetical protein NHX12_002711 [Muraenolepis orangiensis]|uniref:Ran-binding protein 10 n=1 Tax=Muraenolepis orangiensis TaxID=630683 RepID=A0A9Q0DX70_9TELE|nr:hypothetical protein NHX12_002711 [Muraenolepis orangiensis]